MREMIWVAPDGHRYTVTLVQEPLDRKQSIVFRRDGWMGTAAIDAGVTLTELLTEDLVLALNRSGDS